MLKAENVAVRYGALTIVDGVSFRVGEGQWLMIVGPNGAGKSTLVNAVTRGIPYTGTVRFAGRDTAEYRPAELARRMGMLMQSHAVNYSFTVEEVVRLGRYAWSGGVFAGLTDEDAGKIEAALAATGLTELRGQSVLTLSGGELQRTFLAQLLAQDPRLLLLDEPSNHLDLAYQKGVFGLIRDWLKLPGRAVISVVHDLSLAKAFGTHALLMSRGKATALGEISDALSEQNLRAAYGMDVHSWMREMLGQWT